MIKNPPANAGDIRDVGSVLHLGQEDPLEEGMATHSSTLAWRIPRTEETGGLQSMGSQSQTQLSDQTTTTYILRSVYSFIFGCGGSSRLQ